jgi:hypothetical protein
MNVLRHQYIASNHEAIARAHGFKLLLKDAIGSFPRQQRLTAITAERHKVKTAALLATNKLRQVG